MFKPLVASLAAGALLLGCVGGGVEWEKSAAAPESRIVTRLLGQTVDSISAPMPAAGLFLFPSAFLPDTSRLLNLSSFLLGHSDGAGHFLFDTVVSGRFNFLASDSQGLRAALIRLNLPSGDGRIDLGPVTLRAPGSVSGAILVSLADHGLRVKVMAPGTPCAVMSDSTGAFVLTGMPPCRIRLAYHRTFASGVLDTALAWAGDSVLIESGRTTDIGTFKE